MPGQRARVFSREFKEAAVRRMVGGEKVRALAEELRVWPKLLYAWRESLERGGPEALLPPGRPRNSVARAKLPSWAVVPRGEETALRDVLQRLAVAHRHYGYRRLTALVRREGWAANHKRVLRLMRTDNLLCLRRRAFVPVTTDSRHG